MYAYAECSDNIAKVTNQRGAIPISLLNSHFHSSIGTSHSKTCITLPPLPGSAQHDNQVNTSSPHFLSHTLNHSANHSCASLRTLTQTPSSMRQTCLRQRSRLSSPGSRDLLHIPGGKYKYDFIWRRGVKTHRGKRTHTTNTQTHSLLYDLFNLCLSHWVLSLQRTCCFDLCIA